MATTVCIIGAGASGLPAAKTLRERGIPFEGFELGSDVGGLWRRDNDSGRSPAYASLHTNTSRRKTAYSDFPMPDDYPDFPHNSQMLEYLEAYADRFELRPRFAFRHRVERVRRGAADEDSGDRGERAAHEVNAFEVTIRSLDDDSVATKRFGAVIVASGHHWNPNWPIFPGSFGGTELHSHAYRTPDFTAGKRVLVVGVGNSACDIACEVSRVAAKTYLSTRRGAHVIPKYLLGRPLDLWLSPLTSRLPFRVQQALFQGIVLATRGPQHRYGFPEPKYRLGSEHPTVSSDLLPLVRSGAIQPKPDVKALRDGSVRFVDGTEEDVDVIIYATGYLATFPFLDAIEPRDNYLPLYRHVVHPDHPGLFFLGLVQPLGAFPPLAEAQAEWVADLLEGRAVLPDPESMRRAVRAEDEERRRRYVDSKRHRMEVHFDQYLRTLRRERIAGRR